MARVLVVDDDRFLASAYRAKLSKAQFDVRIAYDGYEALEALSDFLPTVILLDLVMPNMDGFTFLQTIKQQDVLRSIPVLVVSNLSQQEDVDKALALGADDYLQKSDVSLDEIVAAIRDLAGPDNREAGVA